MAFAISYTDPIDLLEARKAELEKSSVVLPQAVGISSSSRSLFLGPCRLFDQLAVNDVDKINSKKTQIVSSLPAGCIVDTEDGYTNAQLIANVNSNFGSIIVGSASTAVGTSVGLATTAVVGYATVRYDAWRAYQYPPIENEIYTTDNPFENQDWITITSSNLGIGASVSLWQNYSGGTFIGRVYSITNTGGSCPGYATSLTILKNQIESLRSGVSTYRDANNNLKQYKTSYDLQVWSYNRTIQTNSETSEAISSAISLLQQYEGQY